ncbi:hypothetical protein CesoFtcFv8_026011 [Champsocephalus esox]|uniref:Uncharacterized protein n=1 Tax=Champsocephalus esox TaxID=159716 RepID=A0AAN8GCB1_9TELE|nr:hypothetical protein CesoFtcFv8_026011 [Champsocephalus esox]
MGLGWCGTPRGSHGANDDVNSALKPPLGGSGFSGHAPEEVPLIVERQTSSAVMYGELTVHDTIRQI